MVTHLRPTHIFYSNMELSGLRPRPRFSWRFCRWAYFVFDILVAAWQRSAHREASFVFLFLRFVYTKVGQAISKFAFWELLFKLCNQANLDMAVVKNQGPKYTP